jgi:SsrA-binding protein
MPVKGDCEMTAQNKSRTLVQNRKARHNYTIVSTLEAGIVLEGSEVKSLRRGEGSLLEAFAQETGDEMMLLQAFIPPYKEATHENHEPKRPRKLLLHKKEVRKLLAQIRRKGMTLIPLSFYLNSRGLIKVSLGLAEGKSQVDKRDSIKEADWKRDRERLLKKSVQS